MFETKFVLEKKFMLKLAVHLESGRKIIDDVSSHTHGNYIKKTGNV